MIRKWCGWRLGVLWVLVPVAVAAPLERDLGQGLTYVRAQELPADLPPASPPRAVVLDLRYIAADREAAAALAAWLRARAAHRAPVFVLANGETSEDLRAPLRELPRGGRMVVVGIAAPGFVPDLAVSSTGPAERAAYDALAQGKPVAALITDHPDKVRHDEARLSRGASAPAAPPAEGSKPPAAVPLDAALQRAVHLHRSLLALRQH